MARLELQESPAETRTAWSWPAWLVSPNRSAAAELRRFLAREAPSMRLTESNEYPQVEANPPFQSGEAPRICFLDVCSNPAEALDLLRRLPQSPAQIPVVALLGKSDHELALRCLRSGACGCLISPFDLAQLKPLMVRLGCMSESEPASRGRVLCVVPAKGSCGATSLAANLACHCRRVAAEKVLLADMDALAGTLGFILKLKSHYSFIDALSHADDLDAELWRSLVTPYRELEVLMSPQNPMDCGVETSGTGDFLAYVRRLYDLVILDTGGLYGSLGLDLAKLSDDVLLVTTTELAAVYAAKRWLGHLGANGVARSKVRLVISRWRREVGFHPDEVETALGLEVFHILPSDPQSFTDALIEGRPVAPGSLYGKSLAEFTSRLLERNLSPAKSASRHNLLSLFSSGTA